jgi:integrase
MKTTHTFIIHFWLKKKSIKKNGTIPIYARIRLDATPVDISTKLSALKEHWCAESGRVNVKVKDANFINDSLDDFYSAVKAAYQELKDEGRVISAQGIKLRYLGDDSPLRTLVDLFKYHRKFEIKKLEKGTAKNYNSTEKYLMSYIYEKYRTSDIRLTQINYEFVLSFENYLRACEPLIASQPLKNNGIMKHMERFKKMTTIACKLDCIKKDPFTFFTASFTSYDRAFLTMEELWDFEALELKDEGLIKVRDVFVFSCYTGLAHIDVKNLKPSQIVLGIDGDEWIFARREKSKTPIKIPLLDKAKEILKKYSDRLYGLNKDLVLPVYSNQKCNEYLKIIAAKCKISKNITFHVGRHTFATSVTLAHGMPIETVSKLLGHKKLSTTQIYARVLEEKLSEDIGVLKNRLQLKRQNFMEAV